MNVLVIIINRYLQIWYVPDVWNKILQHIRRHNRHNTAWISNYVFSWPSLSNEIENMGCVTAYAVSNSYLRRELQLLRIVLFSHSYRLQTLSSVTVSTCSCLSALPWHVSGLLVSLLSSVSCDRSDSDNLLLFFLLFRAYYVFILHLCAGTAFIFIFILLRRTRLVASFMSLLVISSISHSPHSLWDVIYSHAKINSTGYNCIFIILIFVT